MRFLRFLADFFSALAFLCCHYTFDSYVTCLTLSLNIYINFWCVYSYLFNNLFKADKFTKIQYTYIHKSSQTNWLIKVNYPILQKKSSDLSDKNKRKRKQKK